MDELLQASEATSHVAVLLDCLGHSAEDVAEKLRAHGVRGVRNTVRFLNPLVRYLEAEFEAEYRERASMDVIKAAILRIVLPSGEKEEIALSEATVDFLEAFDRGAYPDLEETR